jgi:hypothetical protein
MTEEDSMSTTAETQVLLTGLTVGESPRWHGGRLWFTNWGAQEIVAVDLQGKSEVVAHSPAVAGYCIDWLQDGRLLMTGSQLVRREADGSFVTHADLSSLSSTATVVSIKSGEVLMTDGPYAEGKEHIGGFLIVEVPDIDAALDWARKLARVLSHGTESLPIEVRPFQDVVAHG